MTYSVLLADPPWRFETRSAKGNNRGPERHYPTLSLEQLQALPVAGLAAENAALFLWACWPSIFRDVPYLLKAWGFEYRTCAFLWVKANPKGSGFWRGTGYYSRANSEPCLLAIRGRLPVAAHDVPQILYAPVRRHSEKPAETHERIERLYPPAAGHTYLELFARQKGRPNWHYWGNEIEPDLSLQLVGDQGSFPALRS